MAMEHKRVGIWLRVPTEDQVKGASLEVRERRARSYAEAKGWEVMEVYRLEAVSGKSVSGHEEAKRMLVDVRRGHITGLIFSKLARLSRNNRELPSSILPPRFSLISRSGLHINQSLSRVFLDFSVKGLAEFETAAAPQFLGAQTLGTLQISARTQDSSASISPWLARYASSQGAANGF